MNFLCEVSQVPGHECRVHMNIKHQCTPFANINGRFFPDTKIIMTTSSNLYNFWWVHEMHAIGHFLCKLYWLFALTRSALGWVGGVGGGWGWGGLGGRVGGGVGGGGVKCGERIIFQIKLNIIVNFLVKFDGFKWNFLNFKLDMFS